MNKKIIGFLILLIFLMPTQLALGITQNPEMMNNEIGETNCIDEEIIEMLNQVNEPLISYYLENLVEFGPRFTGTESNSDSAEYIFNEFEKLGLDVYYDNFKFFLNRGRIGNKVRKIVNDKNVVATLQGTDASSDAVFIICAHYDTTENSPGANDDGSGVASMLSLANIFSKYSFNHTIRFIAFSAEEVGTFGSHDYAKKAYERGENIRMVFNLETFGYTSEGGDELYLLKTARSEWFSQFSQEIDVKYY